jgi:hypothetical protein
VPTVRTTNEPYREIEVDDFEAANLAAMGMLVRDEPDDADTDAAERREKPAHTSHRQPAKGASDTQPEG